MPNGKPFDHPVTDILHHHLPVFSVEIDTLIRELNSLGALDQAEAELGSLVRYDPRFPNAQPVPPEYLHRLRAIRDEAEANARQRGWDAGPRLDVIRREVAEVWDRDRP